MSNSLDLDQDQHSVSPDLDSNCLQRLSTEWTNFVTGKEVQTQMINLSITGIGKLVYYYDLYNRL